MARLFPLFLSINQALKSTFFACQPEWTDKILLGAHAPPRVMVGALADHFFEKLTPHTHS
jgi:hypothetical protein